jgi:hypothetical protein
MFMLGAGFYCRTLMLDNPNPGTFPDIPQTWPGFRWQRRYFSRRGKRMRDGLQVALNNWEIRLGNPTLVAGYLVCAVVGILGIFVLWTIAHGNIYLSRLIGKPNGDAGLSPFQFLVFTLSSLLACSW